MDYTGKLNDHKEYLKVIKKLREKSKYIEYTLIGDDENGFLDRFSDCIISMKVSNKWWGTESSQKNEIYRLKASKEIFRYLKRFETFCKYTYSYVRNEFAEETDFGINDIAFFDDGKIPLLYTVTHEGYITIREDLFE